MIEQVEMMKSDWDYLLVLDACRYDYFSILVPNYLSGDLQRVISPGSSTVEWCKRSFREKYDNVIYISANPFINSKVEVLNFDAKHHFREIVDVWDWGWDEKLGTVHPKTVNDAVEKFKDEYVNARFIIHYLQPHEPYVGYNTGSLRPKPRAYPLISLFNGFGLDATQFNSWFLNFLNKIHRVLEPKINGQDILRKIGDYLNLPASSPLDDLRRKGINLKKAYKSNLHLVLEYVARLVRKLQGRIVVTSDHGERLGEGNCYAHFSGLSDPLLVEVPWFTVTEVVT